MSTPRVLTLRDRRALRGAVLTELTRAEEQCAALTRAIDDIVQASEASNADDEHDPEGTTIAFERAQSISLLRQAEADRDALRSTLARVDDPSYGVCDTCAAFIGVERLMALPATTRCVRCAI